MKLCQGSKSVTFDPQTSIPPLTSKVILITGANNGLGKQSTLELARHAPKVIYLASRSLDKAQRAVDEIKQQVPDANLKVLELDLASFESVKKAARTFLVQEDKLDILMLNAGIMGTLPGLTEDGYEAQWGTNHMGHALLTKLLMPALKNSPSARIVSVASHGHTYVPNNGLRLDDTPRSEAVELGAYGRYYQSKLANVLWVRHMAKMYPQFIVVAVDPGVVQTQLLEGASGTPVYIKALGKLGYRFLETVENGVKNQLWASVSEDAISGEYYESVGRGGLASDDGKRDDLAAKLGVWTEEELKDIEI